MGIAGGGNVGHDRYPGALYDLQKEELFPALFEAQEAQQLEALRQYQGELSSAATSGLFQDVESLTRSAGQQFEVTKQLEAEINKFNERERTDFARAQFGSNFVNQKAAAGETITQNDILTGLQSARNTATQRYGSARTTASRGSSTNPYRGQTSGAQEALFRNRSAKENQLDDAYYAQFGGRAAFAKRQSGGRTSSLESDISNYLRGQQEYTRSQQQFQQKQLSLQQQSLFAERAAYGQALEQQSSQFAQEQAQRQKAYDTFLTEQRTAAEAANQQQEKIYRLAQAGSVRSQQAEQKISEAQQKLGGVRSRRQTVRQKKTASVSPTLGSRELATGLFGQRKPR